MGRECRGARPKLVKLQTRKARQRREFFKRAGIWVFLVFFAVSVLGVALIAVTR